MLLLRNLKYNNTDVWLELEHYGNGRIALQLTCRMDGETSWREPYMTLTSNIPEADLEPDQIIVKNYSENEGADDWMILNELIEPTPVASVYSGYVVMPVYTLSAKLLKIVADKLVAEGQRSRR
jgi:hypothetical protein